MGNDKKKYQQTLSPHRGRPRIELDQALTFCQQCRSMLLDLDGAFYYLGQTYVESAVVDHHSSREALLQAARLGCMICARIWYSITKSNLMDLCFEVEAYWHGIVPEGTSLPQWEGLCFDIHKTNMKPDNVETRICPPSPIRFELHSHTGEHSQPEKETNIISSHLKKCLSTCDSHHRCTAWAQQSDYHPPRLLKLSTNRIQLVDLFDRTQCTSRVRYATLSHCWGSSGAALQLNSDNYAGFLREIDLTQLPPTFSDAVQISRELGLTWLWIDALCIIQGGTRHAADWSRHVKEMSSIYANAYINLAASHAADSSQGCSYKDVPGYHSAINMRMDSSAYLLVEKDKEMLEDWILNSRSWVCQERLFSPRTLHFGHHDVFLECYDRIVSASYPNNVPGVDRSDELHIHKPWPSFDWRMADGQDDELSILIRWIHLSEAYSKLDITRPSDRLPALSGLAKAINTAYLDDTYIAGFFRCQLPQGLLWWSLGKRLPYSEYVAPSWSWLSAPGQVELASSASRTSSVSACQVCAVEMIDIAVDLVDVTDPYGALNGGFLRLQGWTYSLPSQKFLQFGSALCRIKDREKVRTMTVETEFDSSDLVPATLFLISILQGDRGAHDGLILAPCLSSARADETMYRRIGMFHNHNDIEDNGWHMHEQLTELEWKTVVIV